jgi:inhibitor of KinA sporulation pathway (predicted exonuclease)
MKLTSVDLELNQPSGKIIQIGAVIGDTLTGVISHKLRIYVNPNEPISPTIIELCGITQEKIDSEGIPLDAAYENLKRFHRANTDFMNPITWGGGDSKEIQDQIGEKAREDWCFGRRWIDAKTMAVSRMIAREDKILSGGLKTTMKRYGLKFDGRPHDAQDDAENTFKIYHHMLYLIRTGSF